MNRIWTYILVAILAFSLITMAGCLGGDDGEEEDDDDVGDDGSQEELATESETLEMSLPKDMKVGDKEFNIRVENIYEDEVTVLVDGKVFTTNDGETFEVDLDADGTSDIEVEIVAVKGESVDIKVSELPSAEGADDENEGEDVVEADKEPEEPPEGETPAGEEDATDDTPPVQQEPEEVEETLSLGVPVDVIVGGYTFTASVTRIDGSETDLRLGDENSHMTETDTVQLDLDGDGAYDVEVECMTITPDSVTIRAYTFT